MKYAILAIAVVLTAGNLPADAMTQGMATQQGQVQTALVASVSYRLEITRLTMEADDNLRDAYRALGDAETQIKKLLRSNAANAREVKRLNNELDRIQKDQIALMEAQAEKDLRYQVQLATFRKGITTILTDDPNAAAYFERFASGDVKALDSLLKLQHLKREANNLADAAGYRITAQLYEIANDYGAVSAKSVLEVWQFAADIDPEELTQWLRIAALASEVDDDARRDSAITKAATIASTDLERAEVYLATSRDKLSLPGLSVETNPYDAALQIYRKAATQPNATTATKLSLIRTLHNIGYRKYSAEDLPAATQAVAESSEIIRSLEQEFPDIELNESSITINKRLAAQILVARRDFKAAKIELERLLAISKKRSEKSPDYVKFRDETASILDILALTNDYIGDIAAARAAYVERAAILDQIAMTDPESVHKAFGAWSGHTALANFERARMNFKPAQIAFEKALVVGRLNPSQFYMRTLTLGRLISVSRALGDFDQSERYIEELYAIASSKIATSTESDDFDIYFQILITKAESHYYLGDKRAFLTSLRQMQTLVNDRSFWKGLNDAHWHSLKSVIDLEVAYGEFDLNRDTQWLVQQMQQMAPTVDCRALQCDRDDARMWQDITIKFSIATFSDSSESWSALATSAAFYSDRMTPSSGYQLFYVEKLATQRLQAERLPERLIGMERFLASAKLNLGIAQRGLAEVPDDQGWSSLTAACLRTLSNLPDSGVTRKALLDHYKIMAQKGLNRSMHDHLALETAFALAASEKSSYKKGGRK